MYFASVVSSVSSIPAQIIGVIMLVLTLVVPRLHPEAAKDQVVKLQVTNPKHPTSSMKSLSPKP